MDRVKIIGITGGIGAGKSVVSRILRLKGYEVYDCDHHAQRIMNAEGEVKESLMGRYGEECYCLDGGLNKAFLAERIFKDGEERKWVNTLVHSAVKDDFEGKVRSHSVEIIFIESAILRTSGLDKICSEIWLVDADEGLRLQRALSRGGIEEEDLRQRMETQRREFDTLPGEKVSVIVNSNEESLLMQINGMLKYTIENII